MKKLLFFLALLLPIGAWADEVTTTTWAVTSTDDIPAGTKYELDDITLTIGEAGSNDFAVNKWGEPYDDTFKNLICGNEINGNNEGGTFYLFTPKKNGDLTVVVRQNKIKEFYVEESGRVMDAFNGITKEDEVTGNAYIGTYTIPVFANLTYKIYCAGSKMGFYGFTFKGRHTTTWAVTNANDIPAGTKYELENITMTIGEAGSPNFWIEPDVCGNFNYRIAGNEVNGDREGGTFYLFKPKKNGNLTVFVKQNVSGQKKFYVEESGRVMADFNGILPETIENSYKGPYTIPVFANLTYKIYCAGSKMGFYGFAFEGRNDANKTNITFADKKVKALCVANWDADHNGELSMTEAAAVTTLGNVFKENHEITSFDELRFFTGLTELTLDRFYACDKLKSITIPSGVSHIDGGSFGNCSSLEQISVDAGNSSFDSRLQCNAIIERATNKLVAGCQTTIIPASVTIIGRDAFWGQWNISGMDLPESVTTIEEDAFVYCKNLWSINLPKGLTTIGKDAFCGCNLNEVIVQNPVPVVLENANTFSNSTNATLIVPTGRIAAYQKADYWKDFKIIAEGIVADENWAGPYWFGEEGIGATYGITSEGLAINNPKVQEKYWTPQTQVIYNAKLHKGHSYKVTVTAKIPKSGVLYIQLGSWKDGYYSDIPFNVQAGNDFQTFEAEYEDFPVDAEDGHVLFQTGKIAGTSIVRNVELIDMTDGWKVIAERDWTAPYWLGDDGIGATYEMTADGLAINNPKVQENYWTPQTQVVKNAKLQKDHTYKVIVNAKIPSDGYLLAQLGTWSIDDACIDQMTSATASDFKDYEFLFTDYPFDAEDGHVLFQNGYIAGTSVVRSVRVFDLGVNPVDLVYNYNAENHTAEVINNYDGKYKGDVIIPATVKHKGEDYTVTKINEIAFNGCNITSITIPATVKVIEPHSFAETNELVQITVDPSNSVYDSRNNCNAIIEKATKTLVAGCKTTVIPDGITAIGKGAFHSLYYMKSMTIPESVKKIGDGAFAYCFSLEEVQLPSNIESLGLWAFIATPIKSITLPATLTSIGSQAFDGCSQLTEVTALNPVPVELDDGSTFSNRANATLYLPKGSKKAYKGAKVWKDFKETVEDQNNRIYSYDISAYIGSSTEMEINLENWDPFTAYQFDLVLPAGFTLEKDAKGNILFTKGNRYTSSRSISVTPREGNMYRIVSVSTKNEVITGNDGALLSLYLLADEKLGKNTYQAEIKNVIMTTPEEKQINIEPTTVSITTRELLLGDSNDDGYLNVTDAVVSINNILGRPSEKFNKTAADINRDHVVDIYDVILDLNLIKNKVRGDRLLSRAGGTSNDKLTIDDFTISYGVTKQLQIKLANEAAYAGFQFDLVLPEGITVRSFSANTARIPEGIEVQMEQKAGSYRFVGAGLGMEEIAGNNGSIITILVTADESLKGRNLTGYLRDVKLSKSDGTGTTIEETAFKITDETSGDLIKNGKLDAADVKAIADIIMKGIYNNKADVNGDSKVNAADIVTVTNEIK